MAAEVRAADLPEGSIVATRNKVWIRNWPSRTAAWRCSDGGRYNDVVLQRDLDAYAEVHVLRLGYGD